MLIYVNQIEISGANPLDRILGTIAGWLKDVTKKYFSVDDLKEARTFDLGRQKVRTYNSIKSSPHLYSILFSNPDADVYGRQWITEMGIRVDGGSVTFTILLETSDVSTLVVANTIPSRPRVIKYLQDNGLVSSSTCGYVVKEVGCDRSSLIALLSEIERKERSYPLVLVSSDNDGNYPVRPERLQEYLLGLAQVVICGEDIDSWEMEEILGRKYSAWSGAVNIIFPSKGGRTCRRKLFLSDELNSIEADGKFLPGEILSHVTHSSNGYRKKLHFSPSDVRAKRQKDHSEHLRVKYNEMGENEGYKELLVEALDQLTDYEREMEVINDKHAEEVEAKEYMCLELQDELSQLEADNRLKEHKIASLVSAGYGKEDISPGVDISGIKELLLSAGYNPSPEDCLKLIKVLAPSSISVLDSAFQSSRQSVEFRYGARLLGMLFRLSDEFIPALNDGGDSKAKDVFGSNYSASESQSVSNNDEFRMARTFKYLGKDVFMRRHLKIGNTNSVVDSIRVYFHWDDASSRIIIGGGCRL
ncbi:MAG: hypothetical protein GYB56_02710 [Gammaproteobacteria bacterium]|nr:hypothetical protein [Gammaproteobacteria bacterium]